MVSHSSIWFLFPWAVVCSSIFAEVFSAIFCPFLVLRSSIKWKTNVLSLCIYIILWLFTISKTLFIIIAISHTVYDQVSCVVTMGIKTLFTLLTAEKNLSLLALAETQYNLYIFLFLWEIVQRTFGLSSVFYSNFLAVSAADPIQSISNQQNMLHLVQSLSFFLLLFSCCSHAEETAELRSRVKMAECRVSE